MRPRANSRPMQLIICTEPMELVHIDYVGMEVTVATDKKPIVKNVLLVVDHFTRYVQAFVMKNHMARTTAWVLYNNYFSIFGFPQHLMLDQGTKFCEKVIAAMCSLLGIEKVRTTPVPPSDQRVSRKSSPDTATHDRQVGSGEKKGNGPHTLDQ